MSKEELTPRFNQEEYKEGILRPGMGWLIVYLLSFVLTLIDDDGLVSFGAYGVFGIEILLLFGAWTGISISRAGGNYGDSIIASALVGFIVWILWFILFATIDPSDFYESLSFGDDVLPVLWYCVLIHIIGSVTITGILSDEKAM